MKKGFFTVLSNSGIKQHIELSKRLVLLFIVISIPFVPIFWFVSKKMALCIVPLIGLYLSSYFLLKKGYWNAGRYSFLIWLNLGVVFFSSSFGRELGIQMLFFAFVLLPILTFSINERQKMLIAFPISILAFLTLELTNYRLSPVSLHPDPRFVRWVNASGYIVVMGILLAYVALFFSAILRMKNKRDRAILKTAKYEVRGIRKTIVLLQHEINNALTGILNGATILAKKLKNQGNAEELIHLANIVKSNSERIADVIKKIDTIESPSTTTYSNGIQMLDINESKESGV